MEYLDILDEEAQELLLHCAKFLQPKFKDAKLVFKFVAAHKKLELKDCETGSGKINLHPEGAYLVNGNGSITFCFDCKTP